ncbi:hypothetical protein EDD16DRAFT_643604 [Pisolithus croceorrhizus]|nr:hypothetical protein EDD16DRAFT_643604 [Pisolithus croceorrhizus]KAI6096938.1 hypothetical protein EV401DRAFT_2042292 [Pisolithus croceorrhizus]KAI6165522.1 hypothetical protein EDD17DRAFT_235610 [Pisolithus thermaeus]
MVLVHLMVLVRLHRSSKRIRGKLRASSDPTYESRIQAAIQGLVSGVYKTISAAARDQNVSHQTLSDRHLGTHRARRESHRKSQILTPAQEDPRSLSILSIRHIIFNPFECTAQFI